MGRARLPSTTKMLVPLLVLIASSFLAVESAVSQGPCNDRGTETTEESWSCSNGDSKCTSIITSCSSDGFGQEVSGYVNYLANGLSNAVGGGWDCRHKCRSCSHTCSGSQSRTKGISSGSGSSSARPSRPSRPSRPPRPSGGSGSQDCDY